MMKKSLKKAIVLILIVMTLLLSACTSTGIIKSETDETGTMTAYLFTRKNEGQLEYCLSLLEQNEVLDMEAEPNVHKSKFEFDFDWDGNMLAVMLDEERVPLNNYREFGDIVVAFGKLAG